MTQRFGLPWQVFTDDPEAVRTGFSRLRVDNGNTSFFKGREFKIFHEFSLAAAAVRVYRIVTPINLIIQHLNAQVWDGEARVEFLTEGGTPGGSFSTTLSNIRTNRMSTADTSYASQNVVTTGGTHTSGTVSNVVQLDSAMGSGHHHEAVNDDRLYGLPAGTYYIKVTNTGLATAAGSISLRWEERP